jgi:hypothetical protein
LPFSTKVASWNSSDLPSYPQRRFQPKPRWDAGPGRSYCVTHPLICFHWLQAAERIQFKLVNIALRTIWSLYGTSLGYLPSELAYVVWLTFRRKPSEVVLDCSARRAEKNTAGHKSWGTRQPGFPGPQKLGGGTRPTGPIGWLRL